MKSVALLLAVLAAPLLAAADPATKPAHDQVSTWVLLKLTDAGCTVRTDAGAMKGMQGRLRESMTDEQFRSITDQTLYLATECNTRQALAEAALLEQVQGADVKLDPLRLNRQAAVYSVRSSREDVGTLLALTQLGDESGVAVITMAVKTP